MNSHSGRTVMRKQKPVANQTLSEDIQHGEKHRLSINTELHGECTSGKRTNNSLSIDIIPKMDSEDHSQTYIG